MQKFDQPRLEERTAQPYIAIRGTVTMGNFAPVADRLPEVFGWLAGRGIPPAGAPFFRYLVVDMEHGLQIEAGVPVSAPTEPDGELIAGELPAGTYATVDHRGRPDTLIDATRHLFDWGTARGLTWDNDGDRWGCRLEIYQTDPKVQPDLNQWETTLAVRTRE